MLALRESPKLAFAFSARGAKVRAARQAGIADFGSNANLDTVSGPRSRTLGGGLAPLSKRGSLGPGIIRSRWSVWYFWRRAAKRRSIVQRSLLRFAMMALSCVALSGCLPNPFSTRYFQLDVKVQVDQTPYLVTFNWHCTKVLESVGENLFILPIGTHFAWVWETSAHQYIKRRIGASTVLLLDAPTGGECARSEWQERPFPMRGATLLQWASGDASPVALEVFSDERNESVDHTVRIARATIRRLEHAQPDTVYPKEDAQVVRNLQIARPYFEQVYARIWPRSLWSRSRSLSACLAKLTDVAVERNEHESDVPQGAKKFTDGICPTEPGGLSALLSTVSPVPEEEAAIRVPLGRVAGAWVFPKPIRPGLAGMFYTVEFGKSPQTKRCPVALIRDEPLRIDVEGNDAGSPKQSSVTLFDPKSQRLIFLENQCWEGFELLSQFTH